MFVLTPHITIGDFRFTSVNEARVKRSIYSYVDTASIRLPASAMLKQSGDRPAESVETAKQFHEGDKVTIKLGYDNNLQEEFVGFVKRVNFSTPCEVECEGYSWQLRKKTFVKEWKDAKVKEILQHIISGTDITLSKSIPDIKFEGYFRLNDEDGVECLERLKKEMFLTIYFIGSELYAGLEQTTQLDKMVKYRLGWNTIKDDQLKFRRDEDVRCRVRVNYKNKKGKSLHKIFGKEGGADKVIEMGVITDNDLLKRIVNKEAREMRYSGYEGKLNTFLVPFALPGWKAEIEDDVYAERSGAYLLVSTDVIFGTRGARRMVEIGKTLSKPQDELQPA